MDDVLYADNLGSRIVIGMLVGVAISLGVTRLIASLLYQVGPTDPLTFGAVTVPLGVTGLVASLIPAIRAGRVDPSVTLRQD